MIAGHVLFYACEPVALDLVLRGESERNICFDVVNGGHHPGGSGFSPAGLLMWVGIRDAQEQCRQAGKNLQMLTGKYREEWGYKNVLSDVFPTGSVVSI